MFRNSATQVELEGLRHHRYDIYIYRAYIQEEGNEDTGKNGQGKKLPHEVYICMHGIHDKHVSELEKHIILPYECQK